MTGVFHIWHPGKWRRTQRANDHKQIYAPQRAGVRFAVQNQIRVQRPVRPLTLLGAMNRPSLVLFFIRAEDWLDCCRYRSDKSLTPPDVLKDCASACRRDGFHSYSWDSPLVGLPGTDVQATPTALATMHTNYNQSSNCLILEYWANPDVQRRLKKLPNW